jgi:hypothetical protein
MMVIKSYKKVQVILLGFLIFTVISSCKNETLSAYQIIEQTVETYGGLENWNSIKQLSFDKDVTLFLEDRSVQRHTNQFQLFQFNEPFGKIEWDENEIAHQIIYEGNNFTKIENDSVINAPDTSPLVSKAFFASEFVIKQPFDLLRDEVILTREKDTLINRKNHYVISVAYENELPDADRWYYVIDQETNYILANKVVLTDHTSWVENLTYDETTDFVFNHHRKSYRLNEKGEKKYLRAEYFYTDYDVIK